MSNTDSMVSFIIPNWNNKQLLFECISSIFDTTGTIPKEVIIVDNASTDGSSEYIKREFKELIWIQNDINRGYAKAVNQGIEQSQGDFLFFLNNDTKLFEDTTERLLSFLAENPDAGAVAPLLCYPDGRLQISCRRFPAPIAIILEKLHVRKVGPFRKLKLTPEEHLIGGIIQQPMASALMVKRECYEAVGPMDERFSIFFNDVDWCYRLYIDTNYKIFLCTSTRVIHHQGATVNNLGFRKEVEFFKGLMRFYVKHFPFKAEMV